MKKIKWRRLMTVLRLVIVLDHSIKDEAALDEILQQIDSCIPEKWKTLCDVLFYDEEQRFYLHNYIHDYSSEDGNFIDQDSPEVRQFKEEVEQLALVEVPISNVIEQGENIRSSSISLFHWI